jgi:hypothetical protein
LIAGVGPEGHGSAPRLPKSRSLATLWDDAGIEGPIISERRGITLQQSRSEARLVKTEGYHERMGIRVKKTEHSGPKRGQGAFWGPRQVAKKQSSRLRRENAKREIRGQVADPGEET